MKRNIIIAMGEDTATLASAQGISVHLENPKIIIFSPDCFKLCECTPEEFQEITVIGHADKDTGYGDQRRFMPSEFVREFNIAVDRANLDKNNLIKLRCIGCELGLVTEKNKICHAQMIANEFFRQNYQNVTLSALTNRDLPYQLNSMYARVHSDGRLNIAGVSDEAECDEAYDLLKKLLDLTDQIKVLQARNSSFDESLNEQQQKALIRGINRLKQQEADINHRLDELEINVASIDNPIQELDDNSNNHFFPSAIQHEHQIDSTKNPVESSQEQNQNTDEEPKKTNANAPTSFFNVLQAQDYYKHHTKPTESGRSHLYKVQSFKDELKELKGDSLKNKILTEFKTKLDEAQTKEEVQGLISQFEDSDEYKILKTGQGAATRMLHLQTTSIQSLNTMITDKITEIEQKKSNIP